MNDPDVEVSKRAKVRARRSAVQALYQWRMTDQAIQEIIKEFETERDLRKADRTYFRSLLEGIADHAEQLDEESGLLVKPSNPFSRSLLILIKLKPAYCH